VSVLLGSSMCSDKVELAAALARTRLASRLLEGDLELD
jgi:hypothetical protein